VSESDSAEIMCDRSVEAWLPDSMIGTGIYNNVIDHRNQSLHYAVMLTVIMSDCV